MIFYRYYFLQKYFSIISNCTALPTNMSGVLESFTPPPLIPATALHNHNRTTSFYDTINYNLNNFKGNELLINLFVMRRDHIFKNNTFFKYLS